MCLHAMVSASKSDYTVCFKFVHVTFIDSWKRSRVPVVCAPVFVLSIDAPFLFEQFSARKYAVAHVRCDQTHQVLHAKNIQRRDQTHLKFHAKNIRIAPAGADRAPKHARVH